VTLNAVTIPYFAGNQNLVFVPALLALLAATVLICLPIVFAPSLRRSKRRAPLLVTAGVLAAVAVVGAAVLTASGVGTLADERVRLRSDLRAAYDLSVTSADANELINGGKPLEHLPEQAAAAKLKNPEKPKTLRLKVSEKDPNAYDLFIGGQPWPN
jgi:hypothetical protein